MKRDYKKASDYTESYTYPIITIGIVEDVSDAFQLGRMKVRCHAWLDGDSDAEDLPYTQMCAPFFGFNVNAKRGVNEDVTEGHVAYGQWNVPNVGSQVLVTLVDNDHNQRVYIGNVPEMFYSHTLPHGRYLSDRIPKTSNENPIEPLATNTGEAFNGDRSSAEYATRVMDRQVSAYPSSEIGSRIVVSSEADQQSQTIKNPDGTTIDRTQGYVNGNSSIYSTTTPGFHSFSMDDDPNNCRVKLRTTSGHQILMDDTNERIYISTAKGKTWIEIDEKGVIDIYGEQDISISSDADLNLHANKSVRISGGTGIHMTSGNDIRMHSKADTHIKADNDLKIHSVNANIEADNDLTITVAGTYDKKAGKIIISSDSTYDLSVASTYIMQSNGYDFDGSGIKANGDIFSEANIHANLNITAGATISSAGSVVAAGSMSAGGSMSASGSISTSGILSSTADVVAGTVSLRSHFHMVPLPQHGAGTIPCPPPIPSAASLPVVPAVSAATPATPIATPTTSSGTAAGDKPAYFVSRIPQHEPYTRTYLKLGETDKDDEGESTLSLFETIPLDIESVSEYTATNPLAGTGSNERSKNFARNEKWRR